jgi:hypothetical protein
MVKTLLLFSGIAGTFLIGLISEIRNVPIDDVTRVSFLKITRPLIYSTVFYWIATSLFLVEIALPPPLFWLNDIGFCLILIGTFFVVTTVKRYINILYVPDLPAEFKKYHKTIEKEEGW